jgi:hypothetical protein
MTNYNLHAWFNPLEGLVNIEGESGTISDSVVTRKDES